MKYRGINYDTGMRTTTGKLTREKLEPETIAKDIHIIRHELHCNAIRISGLGTDRIVMASGIALQYLIFSKRPKSSGTAMAILYS